jgi:excisionase family DNA binding protein
MQTSNELLSRAQAATYLGVRKSTLAAWACLGRNDLPMIKVGRLRKYRKADLDAFLDRNTVRPAAVEA